jgi:formylglycine-generating enzyme required for sulfatase activity
VYATSANSTASDGTGSNGLFTSHLLNQLKTPGISVRDVFDLTGAAVSQASNRQQTPAIYSQYFETAYLGSRPVQPSPSPSTAVAPQPASAASTQRPIPDNFVRIEGGTFQMGSPTGEKERDKDEVQHRVTVGSFYMGKYQVTQKEWREVMGTTVQQQRDSIDKSWPLYGEGDNYPMYNISWYEAVEYCNKHSEKEGLSPAYTIDKSRSDPNNKSVDDTVRWIVSLNLNTNGYRLPTEAEWEYACRVGTVTPFNTGNNITTSNANYDGNYPYNKNAKGIYREKTTEVGSFAPNPWGLYDMHGNVWEWCWDWYGSYDKKAQADPRGPVSGVVRVLRGGSWDDVANGVRSASRHSVTPSNRRNYYGFRLVRP